MNLEDILKLGLAAYSASQGDAAGAASGLTGILGPIFGPSSQPAGGIGGKSSGDFLSSIFGSSSPTGESPASQGGFLDSLGNIFGTGEGSPTGYTGPSVLPGVLGGLASSFRATPRAGATRKERDKANQYNMIAGILGALATGYGKASDEAAKQKATSELYQIFSGAQPTAVPAAEGAEAAPVQSRSERLNEFIRNNPAMASSAMALAAKDQENQIKMIDLARKSGGRPMDYKQALEIAALEGTPPELRSTQANLLLQEQKQAEAARLEPYRAQLEQLGVQLPTTTTPTAAKTPSIIAPKVETGSKEKPVSLEGPSGVKIEATSPEQYAEASRLLGQTITPPTGEAAITQSPAYGKRPETLAEIRAATEQEAQRARQQTASEQTRKTEQSFAEDLGKIQSSEGYKQNVEKLRGQSATLNKLAALTTEIAKRPDGRIKPQDKVQLAKLAINAIEPGLSVNEGEAAQALIPDSMWWNSRAGKLVADVFGRNEIPVDSLDALLKTTGAYVQAQKNAAVDYLENEVKPTYGSFTQGDKLIGAIERAIPKTDPFDVINDSLAALNKSKGIGIAPKGYVKTPKVETSQETIKTTAPLTKSPSLMGYVNGRPVIGIVKR